MPSIGAHAALASELERLLQIHNGLFYYGNILPDLIAPSSPKHPLRMSEPKFTRSNHKNRRNRQGYRDKYRSQPKSAHPCKMRIPDPHYRTQGTYTLVPDLDRFWCETEFQGFLELGYAAHLLSDRAFLEKFCPQHIVGYTGLPFFTKDKIYRDYTRLNPLLVEQFNLDLPRINHLLHQEYFYIPIDEKNFRLNVSWINNREALPAPEYINFHEFTRFIQQTAQDIILDTNFRILANDLGC